MAVTTNYNWSTPDDTALVKDGAAAIRTLGSSIDTTTKALNPSTTLGDIEYRSATANTNTRLGIGTTGQVLTVSGGVPAWSTPASGGGMTLLGSGTLSGAAVTLSSISSSYNDLLIILNGVIQSSRSLCSIRLNNSTTNVNTVNIFSNSLNDNFYGAVIPVGSSDSSYYMDSTGNNAFAITVTNYAAASKKAVTGFGAYCYNTPADSTQIPFHFYGGTTDSTAYNRVDIVTASGTFSAGNYKIYGVK